MRLLNRYRELILYCLIGCTGATLDFVIYAVLTEWAGLHYQLANFISISFGIVNNFFWNYFFNFKTHDHLVMCGGSGLYIDAVCNGLDAFPEPDMELRDSLNRRLQEEGLESLRYQLRQVDPESYETIDIANPQRVVRALEVTIQTGRKYSDWKTGNETTGPEALPKKERPFRIEKIGLAMDREKLYDRINRRVEKMMEDGLLDEVRALDRFRYKGNVFCPDLNHIPPLRTVGYRELFDYLDGKTDLDTAVESIKRNTRRYAKRQMSYWGRDNSIKWKVDNHR